MIEISLLTGILNLKIIQYLSIDKAILLGLCIKAMSVFLYTKQFISSDLLILLYLFAPLIVIKLY